MMGFFHSMMYAVQHCVYWPTLQNIWKSPLCKKNLFITFKTFKISQIKVNLNNSSLK